MAVCDTVCVLGDGVTLFAKNSDRPPSEPQIVEAFPRRAAGGTTGVQYIEIPETGAYSTLLPDPPGSGGPSTG